MPRRYPAAGGDAGGSAEWIVMVEVFCQDAVASRVGARLTLSSLGSATAGACAAPSSVVCGGASSLTGSPTAAPTVAAPIQTLRSLLVWSRAA